MGELLAVCICIGFVAICYIVLYYDLRKNPPYRIIEQIYPVYYDSRGMIESEMRVTNQEREYLARYLECYASYKTDEYQQAVVTVIMNRLDSGKFGNCIPEILADELPELKTSRIPSEREYINVDYALEHNDILPKYVYYFTPTVLSRKDYHIANIIDGAFFGYMNEDKDKYHTNH